MRESKHTPGEWKYEKIGQDHYVVSPAGRVIAAWGSRKERDANADLIERACGFDALLAQRDKLLEACQSVVANWEEGDLAAAARQCAAAIADATA